MTAGMLTMTGRPVWKLAGAGTASVAIAERDALGTTARLAIWPAGSLRAAIGAVDRELARLDRAASRFRADSEVCRLHQHGGGPVRVSDSLAEAVRVALAAAQWTGGLVDPTVGAALIALGYDRDFATITPGCWAEPQLGQAEIAGWRRVRLDGEILDVPAGVLLDLGATAKGLGADWSAQAAMDASRAGGVLVSLGGDLAAAGEAPEAGWPVLVADDHRLPARPPSRSGATQTVRFAGGGLATSSIVCRRWERAGQQLHHIVDPRTGLPASGPWRTVSVAAPTCAQANAASTAAIISGDAAPDWLASRGLPARLVARDGSVVRAGDWPAAENGQLTPGPGSGGMR